MRQIRDAQGKLHSFAMGKLDKAKAMSEMTGKLKEIAGSVELPLLQKDSIIGWSSAATSQPVVGPPIPMRHALDHPRCR